MEIKGLVSVIIPTYNRSSLCIEAVNSVLAQSYDNIEIIVVDDGSVDDTKSKISNMDKKVRYIWKENSGVSASRNTGMQAANGEYIAFLDSDDTWLPWKVEAQINVFNAYPNVGMVWTDMSAVDDNGKLMHERYLNIMYGGYKTFDREKHFRENMSIKSIWNNCPLEYINLKAYVGNIFEWMFQFSLVHTSTVILKRERQKVVGDFDLNKKTGEDYDFHLRTCQLGDVAYVDLPSIRYRIGGSDQLSQPNMILWIAKNDLITITSILDRFNGNIGLPKSIIKKRLARSHAWIGMEEFDSNKYDSRIHFKESISLYPFQWKLILYYMLTYMPKNVINQLKKIKYYV